MAAETLAERGYGVEVFDAMPSPARKFLLAGKGGLNLTHSEPLPDFAARYGANAEFFAGLLAEFGPQSLRDWAHGLGIDTFVGTSGRVFPKEFKAAPLLRAWVRRLKASGVRLHARHRWLCWTRDGRLLFATPGGEVPVAGDAVVLALGGASWPSLGSDAAWVAPLIARGVAVAPLKPANCGFDIGWSEHLRHRFAGAPLKSVVLSFAGQTRKGEMVVTETGIEGGQVYALSAPMRDAIARDGAAIVHIDLKPDWSEQRLCAALSKPRGSRSLSSHLDRTIQVKGVAAALLREVLPADALADPARLAAAIKALPLGLKAPRPLAEAISTAGGVRFDELDDGLMLKRLPGVFVAGEMLDWEAPTGGYLLTACFALGRKAGMGAADWLAGMVSR